MAPIRGLGLTVAGMLVGQLVLMTVLTVVAVHQRGVVRESLDMRSASGLATARHAVHVLENLTFASVLAYILTGVVYIAWLFRARRNLDNWDSTRRLVRQDWTVLGWLPVVNLFMPFVTARNVLRETSGGVSGRQLGLLVLWQLTFGALVVSFAVRGVSVTKVSAYVGYADRDVASLAIQAVATLPAAAVVLVLTAAQARRNAIETA